MLKKLCFLQLLAVNDDKIHMKISSPMLEDEN
jgi:hypothetical protein